MLFNSFTFIFIFLPILLIGYSVIGKVNSRRTSFWWLVFCSIVFYSIWAPINLVLVMCSICVNYIIALQIRASVDAGQSRERLANLLLAIGIIANLCFLGYFKYKNFFAENINEAFGLSLEISKIVLPLGISFITFQKIGFLIDVRSQTVRKFSLDDFFLFVFFFPQLIAGPIVHYREMMPQFEKITLKLDPTNIAIGFCLFSIGLFKKVILADGVSAYVSPGFLVAAQGESLTLIAAWTSALAFTFQVYFDFSGYTDMALGLARMFGIRLPMNFNSPLKASSIIEFWSRWHITLTRFLTAYIYTPLVINLTRKRMHERKSILLTRASRMDAFLILISVPTMFTMLISGLWHGAGYTYIVWGAIHGVLLVINHGWRQWRPNWPTNTYVRWMNPIGFFVTFIAIVFTMVVFRADSLQGAWVMYQGMIGLNGTVVPLAVMGQLGFIEDILVSMGVTADLSSGRYFVDSIVWIVISYFIVIVLPNSLEIMRRFEPALHFEYDSESSRNIRHFAGKLRPLIFEFRTCWSVVIALAFVLAVLGLNRASEFLYWQF